MSPSTTQDRLALKTPEAAFLRVLREEFQFSQRVSRELLQTAQEMLVGSKPSTAVRPGQVRQVVTSLKAPFGPSLAETAKVEITLTVDGGADDAQVKAAQGIEKMRQGQILRLTEEALEQGGILTQEDLARALGVERRTIVRAIKELKADGHLVQTRGAVKGVGAGVIDRPIMGHASPPGVGHCCARKTNGALFCDPIWIGLGNSRKITVLKQRQSWTNNSVKQVNLWNCPSFSSLVSTNFGTIQKLEKPYG